MEIIVEVLFRQKQTKLEKGVWKMKENGNAKIAKVNVKSENCFDFES